eukprot:12134464-Prorocentrum_lima.AAC.1
MDSDDPRRCSLFQPQSYLPHQRPKLRPGHPRTNWSNTSVSDFWTALQRLSLIHISEPTRLDVI